MSDELISRKAAIDELKRISFSHWFECGEYLSEDTREIEIINSKKALEVIEALPSAQPKTGRWIPQKGGGCCCSECGRYALDEVDENFIHVSAKSKYCPHCGVMMLKEGEKNE